MVVRALGLGHSGALPAQVEQCAEQGGREGPLTGCLLLCHPLLPQHGCLLPSFLWARIRGLFPHLFNAVPG